MKRQTAFLGLSAALVGVMAFSAFGGATASAQTPSAQQTQPDRVVRVMGRVQSVSSTGLVLQVRGNSTITANVGQNTWIAVEKNGECVQGTLSDIQTQQPAAVAGMTTGNRGVINARSVMQCRRGEDAKQGQRGKAIAEHGAVGAIKAISGTTITMSTQRGADATINTSADTVVVNGGFKAVSSLKVGDNIQVVGAPPVKGAEKPAQKAADGGKTINARILRVVTANSSLATGKVASVNGNTLTLERGKKGEALTINVDSSTGYRTLSATDGKLNNAAQADVKVGSQIIVEGVSGVDGNTVSAKAVVIMPEGKGKNAKR